MNKQAIISENGMEYLVSYGKDGQEKKRYCLEIDAWKPTYPGDICPEYMLNYCEAKGLDHLEWYVKTLEEQITKQTVKKGTEEVIQTITRKRTPSEVKQQFIARYFPQMKRVKDEEYKGHASRAKDRLEQMRASQASSPKKGSPKVEQPKE